MKKIQKKIGPVACAVLAVLFLSSCAKDSVSDDGAPEGLTGEDLAVLLQADDSEWVTGEILHLAEEAYAMDELAFSGKQFPVSGFIPRCAVITTVREDQTVLKTIEFSEGCETPNGNRVTGLISLRFEADLGAMRKTITLSLEGFAFNGISVEGGAVMERSREGENGHPRSEVASAFQVTWPDGETASWDGNRTREWIEGYGSGFWGDNAFLISGSHTLENRSGGVISREVLVPLRREAACRFLVSGQLQLSRPGWTAVLDFGEGDCDAFAELRYPDGTTEPITLRRPRG
jgi:hypothetical protein